jgi:hypothetical protein
MMIPVKTRILIWVLWMVSVVGSVATIAHAPLGVRLSGRESEVALR